MLKILDSWDFIYDVGGIMIFMGKLWFYEFPTVYYALLYGISLIIVQQVHAQIFLKLINFFTIKLAEIYYKNMLK